MNWKLKAGLQNAFSRLPEGVGRTAYYSLQRAAGGLRKSNPVPHLAIAVRMVELIERQGRSAVDRTFLEVGTGHRPILPIAFFLLGAKETFTIDLNRYLRAPLVFEDVAAIRQRRAEIELLFGKRAATSSFRSRFDALLNWRGDRLEELLGMMRISYFAPADASRLNLPSGSIDYHVSNSVAEHISAPDLERILHEASRLVRTEGLLVHRVDLSDHFSHTDDSISSVNFLRYTEWEWLKFAGNRFAYHNRLRIDEFIALLERCGLGIEQQEIEVDAIAQKMLEESRLPLDRRFRGKSPAVNATRNVWIVARPFRGSGR